MTKREVLQARYAAALDYVKKFNSVHYRHPSELQRLFRSKQLCAEFTHVSETRNSVLEIGTDLVFPAPDTEPLVVCRVTYVKEGENKVEYPAFSY